MNESYESQCDGAVELSVSRCKNDPKTPPVRCGGLKIMKIRETDGKNAQAITLKRNVSR